MAIKMNSLLDFTSAVTLKQRSRSSGSSIQYAKWARSSEQKMKFTFTPSLLFLGSGSLTRDTRMCRIPLAMESSEAAIEPSTADSANAEVPPTGDQLSSKSQPSQSFTEQTSPKMEESVAKRPPLTAKEKLRAARLLSRYAESKPSKQPMGSKVLEALRESDKGLKRKSGLPEAPTNLFDDSKRGLPKQGWTFELPGGNDVLLIAFSFVLISTIMLGTTYIVWKVGAIHFNEY